MSGEINLQRQLQRLQKREEALLKKYLGKEDKYTFHAGYDLGYVQGAVRVLEHLLEEDNECN